MRHLKSAGFLLLGMVAATPVALAQPRGGGGGRGGMPPVPIGAALDKVPVGTWAEYEIKRGDEPARKVRQALVSKAAGSFVLETRTASARGDKVVSQATVGSDPAAEGGVKKVVTQFGDADPMEMPVRAQGAGPGGGPGAGPGGDGNGRGPGGGGGGGGGMMGRMGGARFLKPDPKALVGKETLKLTAGTFATEHYKQTGPRGGTVEYWLAKDAGPLGVVKVAYDRPAGGDNEAEKVTMELVGKGKGATPEITKPAKPFDPEAMRARFGRGPGGPGGPGGGPQ